MAMDASVPAEDQVELAREVGDVGEMCESLNTWGPLIEALNDWRRTARAWAEGARPVAIVDAVDLPAARPA
jgi:hypothetical protein